MKTKNKTGLALAVELLDEYDRCCDCSDKAERIATSPFAVVVERDDDSWVLAAQDWHDVAKITLGCYVSTEGYDEWVGSVVDMATGTNYSPGEFVSVTIVSPDGIRYTATNEPS